MATGGAGHVYVASASPVAVTCTITNTRTSATMILQKTWVNGGFDDTATLSVSGSEMGTADSATSTASGVSGSETDTVNRASVTAFSGDSLSLAEALGTTNIGTYTAHISCDQPGLTPNGDGQGGTFDVPASPDTVTCTITNTRTSATMILQKTWVDAAAGDTTDLSINGSSPTTSESAVSVATGVAGAETDSVNQVVATIYSGQGLVLAETFGDANSGTYADSMLCTESGLSFGQHSASGSYLVPAVPVDVTCAFTNTRTSATITLRKAWVNAASGDTANLSISGSDPGAACRKLPATSTASGAPGTETDIDNQAVAPIFSGETVSLVEDLGAGNRGSYTSQIACSQHAAWVDSGRRWARRNVRGAGSSGSGDLHDHQYPHLGNVDLAEGLGDRRQRRHRRIVASMARPPVRDSQLPPFRRAGTASRSTRRRPLCSLAPP